MLGKAIPRSKGCAEWEERDAKIGEHVFAPFLRHDEKWSLLHLTPFGMTFGSPIVVLLLLWEGGGEEIDIGG